MEGKFDIAMNVIMVFFDAKKVLIDNVYINKKQINRIIVIKYRIISFSHIEIISLIAFIVLIYFQIKK